MIQLNSFETPITIELWQNLVQLARNYFFLALNFWLNVNIGARCNFSISWSMFSIKSGTSTTSTILDMLWPWYPTHGYTPGSYLGYNHWQPRSASLYVVMVIMLYKTLCKTLCNWLHKQLTSAQSFIHRLYYTHNW